MRPSGCARLHAQKVPGFDSQRVNLPLSLHRMSRFVHKGPEFLAALPVCMCDVASFGTQVGWINQVVDCACYYRHYKAALAITN